MKIGIIGAGRIGKVHAKNITRFVPQLQIKAVADPFMNAEMEQFAKELGLEGIRSVSVMSPGVSGQTGIEASELIKAVVSAVKPAAVIVIDALAARSTGRLFTTVQICDTGISPGSGVQNKRKELSAATLSVPVIAVGVPTVVGAEIMAEELTDSKSRSSEGLFVTPKDVDMLTDRISGILARAINSFLQPEIEPDILSQLV